MMAGEIQEPFNLSLLENSIYSGSISFGRFEKESLSWEKRSSFSHNRYLEEAERFSKPGSVTQMRAHFEAHFKTKGIRFPSSLEAQTWREVVHHDHHHPTCTKKDYNTFENTSQFDDSCLSYDDDHHTNSPSFTLEKNRDEITLEAEKETKSSLASRSSPPPLKNVKKASLYSTSTKDLTKKHVVITKKSPSCNTKIGIDTKREKEVKPKMVVKTITSQAPTTKKTESLTPPATIKNKSKNCIDSATREKRATTNGIGFRSSLRSEKRKEEKVEVVVPKARPMPKSIQHRPQHMSIGQVKTRDNAQEHSSKVSSVRSLANGIAKSKLNINKYKEDIQSSDQTARKTTIRRNLAVRSPAVEVAL